MNRSEGRMLMESMHPNFFEREDIRNIPEEWTCDEMVLRLKEFDDSKYYKAFDEHVTFGYYTGDFNELTCEVKKVVESWVNFFNEKDRVYCGYIDGKIASFCLIEDMGVHNINGQILKIGGPGCVGTVPEYRNRGIGLTMVNQVTQILKNEGYDYSYIHYTGVPKWYSKIGYETTVTWNKNGIIE